MKLSELRASIRNNDGNPKIPVMINGTAHYIPLGKTALIKSIGGAFEGETRAVETNLEFKDGVVIGLTEDSRRIVSGRAEAKAAAKSEPKAAEDTDVELGSGEDEDDALLSLPGDDILALPDDEDDFMSI